MHRWGALGLLWGALAPTTNLKLIDPIKFSNFF